MDLINNLTLGFGVAFTMQNLIYAFIGCLLGTLIGVLPGIGPVATIAMLLPATYALPPVAAQTVTVPPFLVGEQVTLFGPPDTAKMAVNAMNAYHRKLRGEPAIVEELSIEGRAKPSPQRRTVG